MTGHELFRIAVGCVAVTAVAPLLAAGDILNALPAPVKEVKYSDPAQPGRSAPLFQHGLLIQFSKFVVDSPALSRVYIYGDDGTKRSDFSVWPHNSVKVLLTSASCGDNHAISVAGRSFRADGSSVGFIVTASTDGGDQHLLETGDYLPTRITLSADGTVWALGANARKHDSLSGQDRYRNYFMLKHFDAHGYLIEELLPRWNRNISYVSEVIGPRGGHIRTAYDELGSDLGDPALDLSNQAKGYASAFGDLPKVYMVSSRDGLIIYDEINMKLLIWSTSAHTMKQYRIHTEADDLTVDGFAVLSQGDIVASRHGQPSDKSSRLSGLYKLSLGVHGGAEWQPIYQVKATPSSPQVVFHLLGADGTHIVYKTTQSTYPVEVLWSDIPQ